jgi:hypothetical protein
MFHDEHEFNISARSLRSEQAKVGLLLLQSGARGGPVRSSHSERGFCPGCMDLVIVVWPSVAQSGQSMSSARVQALIGTFTFLSCRIAHPLEGLAQP